jgi:ribose-phosphate pyrophosphokinase
VTTDLHAGQIQGFFDIPLDNLFSVNELIKDMNDKISNNNNLDDNLAIVSPDVGGVVRARAFAKRMNAALVIIDKRREGPGMSEVMNIIGEVRNKTCILLDDIADSAGTLCNAAKVLKENGANEIYSYIVHGVLSGNALKKIQASEMKELVLTDSIPASKEVKNTKNIRQISIAPLMGEAIKRINSDSSVSALFE